MTGAQYHPPNSLRNKTQFWKFPPVDVVLEDLRLCGGRIAPWLLTFFEPIEDQEERSKRDSIVLMELARLLNSPDNLENLKLFEELRRDAETAATWLAEETLYDQATSGRKEHQMATRAFLERRLAGKWSSKGSIAESKSKRDAAEQANYEQELEAAMQKANGEKADAK